MEIRQFVTQIYSSNITIVEKNNHILIIDSGLEPEKLKTIVGNKKVDGILLTHGHYDHCAYCNEYAEMFNTKIYASKHIKETMSDKVALYSEQDITFTNFERFIFIDEDCKIKIGEFEVECYLCQGHSKCSECYIIDKTLFSGDVLFKKSFGRYDLKGSNKEELLESINKIEKLDFDDVYCGHGEKSNKDEQLNNFVIYKRFLTRNRNN